MKNNRLILGRFLTILMSLTPLAQASNLEGDFKGAIKHGDNEIPLIIHLSTDNGNLMGTLDSVKQGVFNKSLSNVSHKDGKLAFDITDWSVHYEGEVDTAQEQVSGTFIEGQNVKKLVFGKIHPSHSNELTDMVGDWQGTIHIPGSPLRFVLHLKQKDGQLVATADSPDQKAYGMKIDSVSFVDGQLNFDADGPNVHYRGQLTLDKSRVYGMFEQRGKQSGLEMVRVASK
ncbi:MAG: hypothetical protein MJK04_01720 [Psychrosphaera sp.]|nr:hypothetical protein [Psychrosphaera sp.]